MKTNTPSDKTFTLPMSQGEFRNLATGVGNTVEAAEVAGAARSAKVMAQAKRCGKTDQDLARAGYSAEVDQDEDDY